MSIEELHHTQIHYRNQQHCLLINGSMLKFNGVCKWVTQLVAVDALVVDMGGSDAKIYRH